MRITACQRVFACRECFYTYFAHRFRAMFGKSKLVRSGDKVGGTENNKRAFIVKGHRYLVYWGS